MKILIASILLALMAGCSSSPSMSDIARDQMELENERQEAMAEAKAREVALAQKGLEDIADETPEWVARPPIADQSGIYAVGIGSDTQMRISMSKARLEAEFGLAKTINQELTGSERSYYKESQVNSGSNNAEFTIMIDKVVKPISVKNYSVVQQIVKPIQGSFHSFVLLKLPFADIKSALEEQNPTVDPASTADDEFKALFDRIEAYRAKQPASYVLPRKVM